MKRVLLLILAVGCGKSPDETPLGGTPAGATDTASTETTAPLAEVTVTVTLDGVPTEGITVSQGGGSVRLLTDVAGRATLVFDPSVPGARTVIAAHPEARTIAVTPSEPTATLGLVRFDPNDNPAFVFQDPGTPDDRADTSKCAHCHETITADWVDSPHRGAAKNPHVHDVYAGTAALGSADCAAAGGQWWQGLEPGTGAPLNRCYLGGGTLPDLNPGCGDTGPCDGVATETGACADCHAPGIDGALGGRDLLEARGHAYEYGVHCDVCHKVESVDLSQPAGVGGRLKILRPSEPDSTFTWKPLTFGPYGDVANPRMGGVGRELFTNTALCSGCHEHNQPVLVPGEATDPARWPVGKLPIHTTWTEWNAGALSPGSTCLSCHMPPAPEVGNSADLYNILDPAIGISASSGWPRPPGAVKRHLWVGPRAVQGADVLALAAAVDLDPRWEGTDWVVEATVTNVAAGHGIPTGEPARNVLLAVEADCSGVPLAANGGDVLPDYAGALDIRTVGVDDDVWPGAQVGERIRAVRRTGAWRDYAGYGPFGDGSFDAVGKGVPEEVFVGEAEIVGVVGEVVTLDAAIPSQPGDIAYRVPAAVLPVDGAPITALAGAPGYGFARVLADAAGNRMVPHHAAVDVVSDQRLMPQQSWTSVHRFDATGCGSPTVRAVLVHRGFPWAQAELRGWDITESVMVEAVR